MKIFENDLNKILPPYIQRTSGKQDEGLIYEELRLSPTPTVISGGQSGVDSIGLECASSLGLPAFAILPKGGRREDGSFADYAKRKGINVRTIELDSESYRLRTYANVYYADLTLIYDFVDSEGTRATVDACQYFKRPYLVISECSVEKAVDAARLLIDVRPAVINVAGNSGSKINEDILSDVYRHLSSVLRSYCFKRKNTVALAPKDSDVDERLDIAIPNFSISKAIFADFLKKEYQIDISYSKRLVYELLPFRLILARPREIINLVRAGVDVGFVGEDLCIESDYNNIIMDTGLIPNSTVLCGDMQGSDALLCSQYPNLSKKLFPQSDVAAITGSAESYLALNIYSAAVDTYQTGRTVKENGINVSKKLMESSLVMIGDPNVRKSEFFVRLIHYLNEIKL